MMKKLVSSPIMSEKVTIQGGALNGSSSSRLIPTSLLRADGLFLARRDRLALARREEALELLLDQLRLVAGLDREHALDDHHAHHRLLLAALAELARERDADDVGDERAVEGRDEGEGHAGADARRVGHVAEHRDETHQGREHPEGGGELGAALDHLLAGRVALELEVDLGLEHVADLLGGEAVDD